MLEQIIIQIVFLPKGMTRPFHPARIKIADALRGLLEKKEFNAITTAEIARSAGVTEALIYKYFKDKRDLLHQVLVEYLEQYHIQVRGGPERDPGRAQQIEKADLVPHPGICHQSCICPYSPHRGEKS